MPRLGGIHAKFIIWQAPDKLFNIIQDEKRNEDNKEGEEPRSPERGAICGRQFGEDIKRRRS